MTEMTRTISTSAPLRTMSKSGLNKPGFGRDVSEFLRSVGERCSSDEASDREELGVFVRSLATVGNEKTVVRVSVSNPSGREDVEFTLMREHAEEMGIEIGRIAEEMLPELEYFAEVAKAYSSACSSFAYTYCSFAALRRKLLQKGFPKDVCDDAMECVKRRGFLNEDEIAVRRVQVLAEKRWGRQRIVAKLYEEGFDSKAMSAAHDQLDLMDFTQPCAELIRKKYGEVPADPHERELMFASLSRMGYSTSDIREAIKLLR